MVNAVICLTVLVLQCVLIRSAVLRMPPFMKTCYRNDPNFKECALKSAREAAPYIVKGDRKYRMPSLDPIVIEHVETDTSSLGFAVEIDDMKFYGMPEAEILDFDMDFDKHIFTYKLRLPRCEIISNYNISGKVLFLPITGNGKFNLTFIDYVYRLTMNYDLVKKDNGKEFMKMAEGSIEPTTKKAYVKLDNLFNGDKLLGDQMNLFLNENYNEIQKEFEPIVKETIVSLARSLLDNTIGRVPYDEVFPIK